MTRWWIKLMLSSLTMPWTTSMPLVCMSKCMNEWVNEWQFLPCIYEWVTEWVTYQVNDYILHCIGGYGWMTKWVHERVTLFGYNIWTIRWMSDLLSFQSWPILSYWSWCWSVQLWRCPGGRWNIWQTLRMMRWLGWWARTRLRVCLPHLG